MKTTLFRHPSFRPLLLLIVLALWAPYDAAGQDPEDLEARVADLFERTCARAGCHAGPVPQQGLDLTRELFYASTVDVPSQERPDLKRVHPAQPDSSYLVMKVRGTPGIIGTQMPFTGEKLTEEEIRTIEEWIEGIQEVDPARQQAQADRAYPFTGWKVINLPTARTVDAGSWFFLISHRFNPEISSGYESLFGVDGSGIILLSLGYAVTDDLLLTLGRSNASDNVELLARYRIGEQRRQRGWPVGVAAQGVVNWITEKRSDASRLRGEAFKFTAQVPVTREFGDRIGVAVVPGILFNPAEDRDDDDALLTVGLGARWRFWRNVALIGEWVPIVSGYTRTTTFGNDNRFDSWGSGVEITTGGHVFQIVVSNSVGLATDQYLRGGDLDIREGDLRLGFNIFRIINF